MSIFASWKCRKIFVEGKKALNIDFIKHLFFTDLFNVTGFEFISKYAIKIIRKTQWEINKPVESLSIRIQQFSKILQKLEKLVI